MLSTIFFLSNSTQNFQIVDIYTCISCQWQCSISIQYELKAYLCTQVKSLGIVFLNIECSFCICDGPARVAKIDTAQRHIHEQLQKQFLLLFLLILILQTMLFHDIQCLQIQIKMFPMHLNKEKVNIRHIIDSNSPSHMEHYQLKLNRNCI